MDGLTSERVRRVNKLLVERGNLRQSNKRTALIHNSYFTNHNYDMLSLLCFFLQITGL